MQSLNFNSCILMVVDVGLRLIGQQPSVCAHLYVLPAGIGSYSPK